VDPYLEALATLIFRAWLWILRETPVNQMTWERMCPKWLWEIYEAYVDNERVIVQGDPERWNDELTGNPTTEKEIVFTDPIGPMIEDPINTCWACQECESFFHAYSLAQMGEYIPEWAAGIIAKYDGDNPQPLPGCEHHKSVGF
jgi:hypothetical protein